MNSFNLRLALALAHFLWEGALIGGVLAIALFTMRRASPQARYLAACAAMAAMFVAFIATAVAIVPGAPVVTVNAAANRFPVPADALSTPSPAPRTPQPWWGWVAPVWLAGVVVFYLRASGGWLRAQRMRSRGSIAPDAVWMSRLRELSHRMGVDRAVTLVESGLAQAPAVIGAIRPMILMPAGLLTGLRTDQVEAILLHELAHIRRHDYLVNLLQSAVEGLLFYHPAVWWTGRVMRTERENCCDDAVVAINQDARGYAGTLAVLEAMRIGEPAMAATGGDLAGRVRRLLRVPEGPRVSAVPLVAAALLLCIGAVVLPALQISPPVPAQRPPIQRKQGQVAEVIRTPYQKWLTEDVAYIISNDERRAFRGLTDDAEREHFIEQFWQRRSPGFKEEHYRRIAYANEQFTDSNELPGWKTDRGRIYITYGPPDQKETHPSGDRGGPPYEEWKYRHLEGVGDDVIVRFEDTNRDGIYRMTSDPRVPPPVPPAPPKKAGLPMAIHVEHGNIIYRAGHGVSAEVHSDGATRILVPLKQGEEVAATLVRDEGTRLLDEAANSRDYSRDIALTPGQYRLVAMITARDGSRTRERLTFIVGPNPLR